MFTAIFSDKSPIGRLDYLKYLLFVGLIQIPFQLPYKVSEIFEKQGRPFSEVTEGIFAILALFGYILFFVMSLKTVFKRARDLEKSGAINKWKWIFLAYFPIVSFYGQFCLFFKRGSDKERT